MYMVNLQLIPNNPDYWEFIRVTRSDPRNLYGFIQTGEITPDQQKEYMAKYNDHYFICIENNVAVGWVGEVEGDLRFCVDYEHQGKGVGTFMLKEFTKIYPNLTAKVKLDNVASKKAFEKAGWKLISSNNKFYYYEL